MFHTIEEAKRDKQSVTDKFVSRLLPVLATRQDVLRPEVNIVDDQVQVVLIAPNGDVIWRIRPDLQFHHHRDGEREFWTPSWQNPIAVDSINDGDSFTLTLYGDEYDNAIRGLAAQLLVREPFIQYAWLKDTHDPLKYRLFADGEKKDAIWKSGSVWGAASGNSFPTRHEAMKVVMANVLMFSATRLLEELTAKTA